MNLYSFRYLNLTMTVGLGKRITIVELFKAGKPQKEICKDLKVNGMLVWRTLKRYKESGNVQNQPGQGRPRSASTSKLIRKSREIVRRNPKRSIQKMAKRVWRNPKRFIQKTAKEANVSYGPCLRFS